MAKMDLAFQLSANASGMAPGVSSATAQLDKVAAGAQRSSREFREAAKITTELRTPSEKYADTIQKLDAYMAKGLLTQEVYNRAVAKAEVELNGAEKATGKFQQALEAAGRAATGTANVIRSVGDAAKSVADAGASVIKFGKDIAWTYLQWKVFSAIRNPSGIKDFAIGAVKAGLAARTLILAAKALGIGLAIGGGAAGTAAAAVLGLTNPLIGGALLTLNLAKAFINAKDRAFEMATAITEGKVSLEQLNAQLGTIQAQQVDNLAFAMEEATAAGQRSEKAFAGLADVFVTPFIGAFAAIQSGLAGFTDGISGIVEGITSILSPIAQAIAPVFTLIGTLVEGVLKLFGKLGDLIGLVLRVAGAFVNTLLSPVIAGWTNLVETIRSGMNAAFDFVGLRIDWAHKKLDSFYKFMSKVPIIGGAFASGEAASEPAAPGVAENPAAGAEEAAKAAADAAREEADELERVNKAIERQRSLLSGAIDASVELGQSGMDAAFAYQEGLRALESQLEAGVLNEASFANEAAKLKREFDGQVDAIHARNKAIADQAEEDRKQEESQRNAITKQTDTFFEATKAAQQFGADGAAAAASYEGGLTRLNQQLENGVINEETYNREADKLKDKFNGQVDAMEAAQKEREKHADDIARAEEKVAGASEFKKENEKALNGPSSEALKANDVRSSEGMSQFLALATGREDPAIAEYRKQNEKLQQIVAELRALQQQPVDMLGAAA
jgi:hypothetical protein